MTLRVDLGCSGSWPCRAKHPWTGIAPAGASGSLSTNLLPKSMMKGLESCVNLRKRDNRDMPVDMQVNELISWPGWKGWFLRTSLDHRRRE